MGIIKADQIVGYFYEDGCLCRDCTRIAEKAGMLEDEIITSKEVATGDRAFFCDRCMKPITEA